MIYFGDIKTFLGPALCPKLLIFVDDNPTTLQVEMAATVDWGKVFVKACHYLEGDGPLALECYERMDTILHTQHIPDVRALAQKLTHQPPSYPLHEEWVDYAKDCVAPGLEYFKKQVDVNECIESVQTILPSKD